LVPDGGSARETIGGTNPKKKRFLVSSGEGIDAEPKQEKSREAHTVKKRRLLQGSWRPKTT